MRNLFTENNVIITDEEYEKFEEYYTLLCEYNEKFNLTAITEKREVFIKHFIDSVKNVDKIKGKLIDIGSGGGFPAIPLKILNGNLSVTMLEATEKKCGFLRAVIEKLKLNDINVVCGRAEDYAFNTDYREKFDYVSARAVARLNILCEYTLPFIKIGGKSILYKGDCKEELKEGLSAIKKLGCELEKVEEFNLYDAKRSIVYIKKTEKTSNIYPRHNSLIRKKPL